MTDAANFDPTLKALREHFAAGDIDAARRAVLQLSPQGRAELETQIGPAAVARMMRASRSLRGRIDGRVVVIHGIMGGKLATIEPSGDEDLVWVNLLRLAAGRIGDFTLDANGNQADPAKRILTRGLMDEYMPLVLELGQRWDVLPFAFDWRLDIDKSADGLDNAIRAWAGGDPVHIVAHSMGGLVSRRFMQTHPDTWDGMKDPNGMHRGGRLIMLGTPNRGSFAIPFTMTGEEKTVRWLARLDLSHNLDELLSIIDSFTGSYQMMPSPKHLFGDDRMKLFTQATWGHFPVLQTSLDRGRRFQEALEVVDDSDRLVYVAGCDQETPYRIRVDGPGRFSYQQTLDGDGRVPHELGLLPGVKTFYVFEKHGSLPSNDRVLAGIHELLATGTTSALDAQKPTTRAVPPAPVWRKASEIAPLAPAVANLPIARGTKRGLPTDLKQQADIAADMLEPFVSARSVQRQADVGEKPRVAAKRTVRRGPPLRVEVVWGDITQVDGNIFVAGHYQGVDPQNAELALDRVVSGIRPGTSTNADADRLVITAHTRQGIIRGAVGDVNFFPWANARKTVAVAGMGYPGTFGRGELQRLARRLVESLSTLPNVRTVNTVLIGSGVGNLPVPVALSALLSGLEDALRDGIASSTIRRVRIVERDYRQARTIARALSRLKSDAAKDRLANLAISPDVTGGAGGDIGSDIALSAVLIATARQVGSAEGALLRRILTLALHGIPPESDLYSRCAGALKKLGTGNLKRDDGGTDRQRTQKRPAPTRRVGAQTMIDEILTLAEEMRFGLLQESLEIKEVATRMSFIRDPGGVRVAAISDLAVVSERLAALDWSLVDELIDRLTDPQNPADIGDYAGLMARLLIPRDFRPMLSRSGELVLEVDRDTARVQWEMVGRFTETGPSTGALEPIGLKVPVARQLRTSYSPPPSRAPAATANLRALVIGDPGDPDKGFSLDGARDEALMVARLLQERGVTVDLLVGAANVSRTGELASVPPATVVEVLRLLSRGSYDIMHYCGHGDFDPNDPEKRAGWLFGDKLFTARELSSVDEVPPLVVANACLSGRISAKREGGDASRLRPTDDTLLPGLADEFFKRGVRNYIGTAWPVSDVGAITFATTLYDGLLADTAAGTDRSLGNALMQARLRLHKDEDSFGALWGAYQHYGDPSFTLRSSSGPQGAPQSATAASKRAGKPAGKRKAKAGVASSARRGRKRPRRA